MVVYNVKITLSGLQRAESREQNKDHLDPHPALELRAPNSLRFINDEIFD